jgi:cell division protein FtsB
MRLRVFWALAGAVSVLGLVRLYGPLTTMREQSMRMAQLRATRSALTSQQSDLESQKQFLATEAGQEEAARQMGYLRPGERQLVFVPETARNTTSAKPTQPSTTAPRP